MKNTKEVPPQPIDSQSKNGSAWLRPMIEASVDCVIAIDAQSTIIEFNTAAEQTFGYRRDGVIGKPLTETIIPPSLREGHLRGMAAVLKGGTSKLLGKRVEMQAMRSDGSEFPVELTVTRIAGQMPPLFTAYLRDITERKRDEAALRESEARSRLLIKSSNIGLWDWNLITNEVFFSPEWKRHLGCADDELPNHYEEWESRLHPEDREPTMRAVQDFHEGRRADYDVEFRLRHKDGSWRWILTRADLVRDAVGQPVRMMGCHIDISARKEAEFALRQLAEVSAASGDYIALIGRDFRYQFVNEAYLKARGLHLDSMIGRHMAEIVGQERFEQLGRPQVEACLRGEEVESFEWTDFRSDFRCFLHVKVSPLRELDGTISGAVMSGRDITGRHEAEEALRESETRFRLMFEKSGVGMALTTTDSVFLQANAAFCALLGRTQDEVVGHNATEFTHPEDLEKTANPETEEREDGVHIVDFETRYLRKDGATVWAHVTAVLHFDEKHQPLYYIAIVEDITERKKAEEKLWHSLNLLRAITESTSDAIFAKDRAGRYLMANTAAANLLGKEREDIVGCDDTHLFAAETVARIVARDRDIMESGETRSDEDTATTQTGASRVLLTTKGPLLDHAGIVMGVFGVSRDITEQKRHEQELRESEQRFRELAENIHEVFWMSDPENTRVIYVSPAYETIWGRSRETLYASPASWIEAVHPDDKERIMQTRANPVSTDLRDNTYRIVRPDRSVRWIRDRGFPVRDELGRTVRFAGIAEDITEQKSIEREMARHRAQLEEAQRVAGLGFWTWDVKQNQVTWSDELCRMTGRMPEEFGGTIEGFFEILHPEDRSRGEGEIRAVVTKGNSFDSEVRMIRPDNTVCVVHSRGNVMRDENGEPFCVFGTTLDITRRKETEGALAAQLLRYRTLMETSTDSIYVLDEKGDLQEANAAFLRRRGYTPAEVKGLNFADWDAQWGRAELQERLRKLIGGSAMFETRHRCKDGSVFDVEVCATSVRIGGEQLFFCVTRDITERKEAEEALRQVEEQYRSIFNNAVDGIFRTSPDGKLLVTNPAAARIFGFASPEEAIAARSDIAQQTYVDPRRREELKRLLQEQGSVKGFEFEAYRKDGSRVWISENTRAVRSSDGKILYFEGTFEDVTDRKHAEDALRESEARFRTIFQQAPLGISEGEIATARFISANQRYGDILGYSKDELRALTFKDYTHPEDLQKDILQFQKLADGKIRTYSMEKRYIRKDGGIIWVHLTVAGLAPPGEKPLNCLAVIDDITERKQADDLLRRSEEKFKALFDLAPVGIAFLDSRLNIVDCNPALERMTRLSREELWGGTWQRRTFLNADGSPRPPGERVTERAVSEKRLVNGVETGAVMERGDIVWAEVSVAPLALPDASAVVIMQDITERKRAAEQLEEANRQLRILSRQLFHIQEEERRHLARELHDEIGQTLTAAKLNLKIIAPDVPARIGDRLDDSIQLLDRLLRQVRNLSLDLRPPLLDELGLVPTIRWLVDQQAQRAQLSATFTANVDDLEIDPIVQTTCFRVAQEAITNIVRHAGAKNFTVELRGEAGRLTLRVCDDGAGFDPDVIQQRTRQDFTLGLVSMKERALLSGGGFEARSAPGQGTEIRAWFPLA